MPLACNATDHLKVSIHVRKQNLIAMSPQGADARIVAWYIEYVLHNTILDGTQKIPFKNFASDYHPTKSCGPGSCHWNNARVEER